MKDGVSVRQAKEYLFFYKIIQGERVKKQKKYCKTAAVRLDLQKQMPVQTADFFFPSKPFVMNSCRWIGSGVGLFTVWVLEGVIQETGCLRFWQNLPSFYVSEKQAALSCFIQTFLFVRLSWASAHPVLSVCLYLVKPQLGGCRVPVV